MSDLRGSGAHTVQPVASGRESNSVARILQLTDADFQAVTCLALLLQVYDRHTHAAHVRHLAERIRRAIELDAEQGDLFADLVRPLLPIRFSPLDVGLLAYRKAVRHSLAEKTELQLATLATRIFAYTNGRGGSPL